MDQFIAKKENEKLKKQPTGNPLAASNKLIFDNAKEGQDSWVPSSGWMEKVKYSFMSMYAEEEILYTLDEIFPRTKVICSLESRVWVEPASAHHLCILTVKDIAKGRSLSWREVKADQAVVFDKIKELRFFIHSYPDVFSSQKFIYYKCLPVIC